MEKRYVSMDVEASGTFAGKYSMLSLGACLVHDLSEQFYVELKPLNSNCIKENMRIGCLGLRCLEGLEDPIYNPRSRKFDPKAVLEVLSEKGTHPKQAMSRYAAWARSHAENAKLIEAAAPIKFDGGMTMWYFDQFYGRKNPFAHSGEDMNSMYRGFMCDITVKMNDLDVEDTRNPAHNALEDAIHQAKQFRVVLKLMGEDHW